MVGWGNQVRRPGGNACDGGVNDVKRSSSMNKLAEVKGSERRLLCSKHQQKEEERV